MSNAILHISDLHFVANADKSKTRFDNTFQTRFLDTIKDKGIKYLIVTGDIADKAQEIQYKNALDFLNAVVDKLNIGKKNVILCLGNHDIYWNDLDTIIQTENIEEEKLKEIHKRTEKYNNFKKFYSDFFGDLKTFDCNNAIFDQINTDEEEGNSDKIIILGINSCYRESNQDFDHIGFIDKESFEQELYNIDFKDKYKDYGKFLVMHHNPKDLAEENNHNLQNWKSLNKDSMGYPFVVFCGHIHGQDGESVTKEDNAAIHYISTSSLTQKKVSTNTFNIYDSIETNEMKIKYFSLQDKDNYEKYYWQELTNKKSIKEVQHRPNQDNPIEKPNEFDILVSESVIAEQQKMNKQLANPKKIAKSTVNQENDTIDLLDFIKQHQLFKSGHFHWKSGFRSHGYIDINFLVSRKESLELITKHFYNKIISDVGENLQNTLILAIGMECNVIGARFSALLPYHYSYIPDPTQNNDYGKIETRIMADKDNENNANKYDNIILLKDVIFEAEHTKDLLKKLQIQDKRIHLLSIFYCGERDKETELFKGDKNVKFDSICNEIAIEKCKHSGEKCDKKYSDCPIFSNELQFIYEC